MPRLIGIPSKVYTESGKISQDIMDFSLEESYNLIDTTIIETLEVQREQGLRDSSVSYNAFFDSDRKDIKDKDHSFIFIQGTAPYTALLFRGLLTENVNTERGSDTNVTRSVTVQQGDSLGFREGAWLAVELTKSGNSMEYVATNTIEEVWVSGGLTPVLSTDTNTNDTVTVDVTSLSSGDPVLIAFRLKE